MMNASDAVDTCMMLLETRAAESDRLETIHTYLRGEQDLPILASAGVPAELRRLAAMSRVNIIKLPVVVLSQSLYVDGFRQPDSADDEPVWAAWQANRMDARQTRLHRGALAYAASYAIVTEGEPNPDGSTYPVVRSFGPRAVTTLYADDPDWPAFALEVQPDGSYRVYDSEAIYYLADVDPRPIGDGPKVDLLSAQSHGFGVCPVVRYLNEQDPDDAPEGEVWPLIPIQDQIDHTTFDLLVAQHFAAFRQRYAIGWIAETEEDRLKTGPGTIWNFEDSDVTVGEFGQTDISNHLKSREASLQHMAIISQTPPHNLLGQMVNLSAEALVAAEVGGRRKLSERQSSFGESHEQLFWLIGVGMGVDVSVNAQVRWRNDEARSLSQTADALGKLAESLHVPVEMLWEMIPGFTQADLTRARALAEEGDAIAQLADRLASQFETPADA